MARDDAELRRSLVRVLREMVGMLGADWAALSARLTSVAHDLEVAPPGPLDGELLRRVQRRPRGTMGGLSDVMCGAPLGGRWVLDRERDARFSDLRRELGALIARLTGV